MLKSGSGRGSQRLETVADDPNSSQKHVWRAQIILATAAGCGTAEIMRRAGVAKPCVWRWQRRFMEAGVDGLRHDKTRKPGKAPVPDPVVAATDRAHPRCAAGRDHPLDQPSDGRGNGAGGQHGAKAWRAHGLAPHRMRAFKLSRDPQFAAKVHDVVGLYVDPPAHSLVLSVDEKSQIQALDRTQPGCR